MRYTTKIKELYIRHIGHSKKEARFLTLIAFTLTFIFARVSVYGIKYHFLPFSYIFYKDVHIHHLVFGILLLLIAGLIRIPQWDSSLVRFSSILYGIGAALTLDEFALWLRLDPDVYFGHEGRISIDTVVLFILILLSTIWYGAFWQKIFRHTTKYFFMNKKFAFMKNKLFLGAGVLILLFYILVLFFPNKGSSTYTLQSPAPKKIAVLAKSTEMKISPTAVSLVTPTLTAVPTVSPTPVPTEIPMGYCLPVPVLTYHHVQPWDIAKQKGQTSLSVDSNVFDQQMGYLAAHGYTSVTSDQLIHALKDHTSLPAKSVVVTIDDAYDDNYLYAFQILKKYHIIGNFMIPTGLLGIHTSGNSYMSWDQLREIAASGVGEVGDHTWSHYALGTGTLEKNQFEIITAKQQLQQNLGKTVDVFTYPYGAGKSTPWVIDLLKQDGFIGAFSTVGGTMQCDSYIYALHRNHIGNASFPNYGIY